MAQLKPASTTKFNWLFGKNGALFRAAANGYVRLAKELIDSGADVSVKSNAGFTPLHRAAEKGHKEMVSLLVSRGADVNAAATDNLTPFQMAHDNGQSEIARLLCSAGAKG